MKLRDFLNEEEEYIVEGKSWLDAARKVVKEHQFVYIDPKTNDISDKKKKGYIALDAVTSNMLVQIADALKDVNKEKFTNMPLLQAVDIGWKLVKR